MSLLRTLIIVLFFIVALSVFSEKPAQSKKLFLSEVHQTTEVCGKNQLIDEININNSKIKNIISNNVEVKISGIPFKLKARIAYEKTINFRMVIQSFVGKEVDVGSNSNEFWFWSRRMNPPYLHYASYPNLYKCGLKEAFHPLWMVESLSIGTITGAHIRETPKYLLITEKRISTENTEVTKLTLVNKELKAIVGHYLLDNGRFVISAEVKSFSHTEGYYIPKRIVTIWYDENVILTWNLNEIRVNEKIDPSNWQMPYYKNKIDMATD